jgi:predicted ATPase
MLDKVLEHVQRSGEFDGQAEMLRLKGEMLLMGGQKPNVLSAEQCFRAALDVARMQEAKWWELRATTSLARLLSKGKPDEARTMLAEIYNWFTEGFDTADLKDAKALLYDLGEE